MENEKISVLSYGGGVNSSAMIFHLIESGQPIDLVIFADTGEEEARTYDAVERMREVLKAHEIPFYQVQSHHGNLYDYYLRKKAVPSVMRRDCTYKFKVSPLRKFLRQKYGKAQRFRMYIGIASDEFHRMRTSDVQYIENSYPLIEADISRSGCLEILERHGFHAEKSGCIGCPFRPRAEWIDMAQNNPEEFSRWERLELNCSAYPRVTLIPGVKLIMLKEAKHQKKLDDYAPHIPCDVSGGCFL